MSVASTISNSPANESAPHDQPDALQRLRQAIDHAANFLPAQGPITVFVTQNPLQAFEYLPFDEGVQQGANMLGCEPYLQESRYRAMLATGRIDPADIEAVLLDSLGDSADELIGFSGTRFHLRQAMLRFEIQSARAFELDWFIAETDALRRFRIDAPESMRRHFIEETRHWVLRDLRGGSPGQSSRVHAALDELIEHFGRKSIDRWNESTWERFSLSALWKICQQGIRNLPAPQPSPARATRLRDRLLAATGRDADLLVNEMLVRICSAFLDQGFARWSMPDRDRGLLKAFSDLTRQEPIAEDWIAGLPKELDRVAGSEQPTLALLESELQMLGLADEDREPFLIATFLSLRGWAGMIQQVETRGDCVARPAPAGSLDEFLLIRLILDRSAAEYLARTELGLHGELRELPGQLEARQSIQSGSADGINSRAFQVFQLAQSVGWLPPALAQLTAREWADLVREMEAFPAIQRRSLFQAAFERRYRIATLDAISIQARQPRVSSARPRFHMICCLDDREESFRRHFEELVPDAETSGAAGFFSVPMYYRGAGNAQYVPLCPIVARPQHWVVERVNDDQEDLDDRREMARHTLGRIAHGFHLGTRDFAGGALLTAGLGPLATIPLVARVLFPRLTARFRQTAARLVRPPTATHLQLRRELEPAADEHGHQGFSLGEMIDLSERILLELGMTNQFAPLVLVMGHGAQTMNNPHNSAYNCGACGGSCGGPNARAAAEILNNLQVREGLALRGLAIPADTWFLGGWHNTTTDGVEYFDIDRIPPALMDAFEQLQLVVSEACARNAHERCRRFMSAPLTVTPDQALRHVEARAEDLAQTRPECGHATNAVCVIGRRSRTRGLYMDRRTFLMSYDPTLDDAANTLLKRVLGPVVTVCGGINMAYNFSYVDNTGFGCGSKLPHNVTSMLGVMDGAASDLRTGLPWQMVEIHEPMRLLVIVETVPEALLRIMDDCPEIGRVFRNGWMQLATLNPASNEIHLLHGNQFELYHPESTVLPSAKSSIEWYRGWRDNLGYAAIGDGSTCQESSIS